MKPADEIRKLINESDVTANNDTDKKILAGALVQMDKLKQAGLCEARQNVWEIIFKNPIAKLATAAVIVIAAVIGITQLGDSSVAWADVAERFKSVPFFSAVVYIRDDVLDEPRQFELWMGQAGRARIRVGSQVIFSCAGELPRAFDIEKRRRVEPDLRAVNLLDLLGTTGEYSLETVIRVILGRKLVDVTPLVNDDAVIQEDLVVFDIQSEVNPQWARIYALRKSKLPVGIRIWGSDDAECVDALITYSKQQPDIFFDAQVFAKELTDKSNTRASLAYMFLKDPGGRDIIRNEP
ncbi:MAG: hypothetical protein JW837_06805 [Sedimentisphaerales bacterium]|nr:hypothetical protein [Sedimentisphaerales bacterium]